MPPKSKPRTVKIDGDAPKKPRVTKAMTAAIAAAAAMATAAAAAMTTSEAATMEETTAPGPAIAPEEVLHEATWDILDTFFDNDKGLVRHQIESMDEFIEKKLQQIIQGFNSIQVYHNYKESQKEFAYKLYVNVLSPALAKPIFIGADGLQLMMTPSMARMSNLTYAANLYVDVHAITEVINDDGVTERHEVTIPGVNIGKIPIMVRSKACVLTQLPGVADKDECRYDPGGYFIINGNEKVVISQDRISENKTLVFSPNGNADGLMAEIRSMPDGLFLPPKITSLHLSGKPNHIGQVIRLSTSFLRSEISLFVMFRALGVESDRDIMSYIVFDTKTPGERSARIMKELMASAEEAADVRTQDQARAVLLRILGTTGAPREYLEQPARAQAILANTIRNDFLPHVGPCLKKKALYLGAMVRKLLSVHLKYIDYDNRDSYIHKRIDTPGVLFANLFRQCYGKVIKDMRNLIVRELNLWRASPNAPLALLTSTNIHRFFKQTLMDTGLRYALSTGNWGVKTLGSFQNIRQGVAQVLNRMSYSSTMSHLRRINTPMEKNGKLVQPRKLENTQFGMICPYETPEGAAVGLVKNMAMSTHITTNISSAFVRECLMDVGVYHIDQVGITSPGGHQTAREFLEAMGRPESILVSINGDHIGYTDRPHEVYSALKAKKLAGVIPPTTSIVWSIKFNEISLSTEAGRMCRPLYTIKNGGTGVNSAVASSPAICEYTKTKTQWDIFRAHKRFIDFMVPDGIIEYLDVAEVDTALISMFVNKPVPELTTHCEIHPSLMNGVLAANIPFSHHNQSPRNCYQCLWDEEPVRMSDGSVKKIRDVRVGDEVLCFNSNTMVTEPTRVVHQYVRPPDNHTYHITTITGRTITATHDHKFSTNQGWRDVRAWDTETRLAICALPIETQYSADVAAVEAIAPVMILNTTKVPGIDERLATYGLIPLTTANANLGIIARLLGYLKVRGLRARLPNDSTDRQLYLRDITDLGFTDAYDTGFVAFMKELEADRLIHLPSWLLSAGAKVRANFVGGYLGAGGQQVFVQKIIDSIKGDYYTRYCIRETVRKAMAIEFKKYVTYTLGKKAGMADGSKDDTDWPMSQAEFEKMVEIKGVMMYIPIDRCVRKRTNLISDISVASDHHSFIGGDGFAVSNSAMGKQALGVYMTNFNKRMDTMAHVLNYPQKPIVGTRLSKYTNRDVLPSGVNAIVAIMTHTGFNQEDSVMVNKSALDRGLYVSTYYKSYRDQCTKNHSTGEEEIFTKPDENASVPVSGLKPSNYGKLGSDGFVPLNTYVDSNDILVGKVMPHKVHGVIHPRDTSMSMKTNDEGYVDCNYKGVNGEGYAFAKIRLRMNRKPVIGDKLASCSAQKGTIGMMYDHQDMPFTKDGIVPDIIMNPHAIPSRMTMGQLFECVMGKAACHLGAYGDATPFNECSLEDIAKVLEGAGMDRYGNEVLYNGRTGEMIHTEIFIGPTFYQRLKHMVVDKAHCLSPDHEVLTLAGWKPIAEVTMEDLVATLVNGEDLVYTHPTAVLAFPDFSGKMYRIKNQAIDLEVTLNHRMYVSLDEGRTYGLIEAGDLIGKNAMYSIPNCDDNRVTQKDQVEEVYDHTGPVYCLQVPSEVFMVRRNGKAVWTGNSRSSSGPVVMLTRQPAEGRARNGGLRFGEMERDAIVAHGASVFLKERMMDTSDNFRVFLCRMCGIICVGNDTKNIFKCTNCRNGADICQVRIPYAMKLLIQELMTMGVAPRMIV